MRQRWPGSWSTGASGSSTEALRWARWECWPTPRWLLGHFTIHDVSFGYNRVFVIGKVNRPGDFPLLRPIDVLQAISMAGGITPFASANSIRVLHRDGPRLVSIRFRYDEVTKGRHLEQNILLQSGDTVIVP